MRGAVLCLLAVPALAQGQIDRLITQLRTAEDSETRRSAAEALGRLGKADETIVAALGKALHDSDLVVRGASAAALAKLGKSGLPVLVEALRSGDRYTRSHVLGALHDLGKDAAPTIRSVVALLKDTGANEAVRRLAPWVLAAIGDASLPALRVALGDSDALARQLAAEAIGRLGQRSDGDVKALTQMLKRDEPEVRVAAGLALHHLGEAAERVLPDLIEVLQRGQRRAQSSALQALAVLGADARSATEPIVAVLRRDRKYRRDAGRIDREKSIEADFFELAGMEDPGLELVGVHALGKIRSPRAVPFLVETIRYTDETVRRARARDSLHRYDPKVSLHYSLRSRAIEALGRIGPGAHRAVPVLLDLFDREPDNIDIIQALGRMGASAAAALPALDKALRSPHADTRAAAEQAVLRIRRR